ncbi:MAG: hypothetical protein LBR84_06230 [Tannerella sp.]|jgi:hypothetical protein|nr:hypothetical protein [Tannerella sp.]
MKDEYTFVTLDNDLLTTGDAVFVDIDEDYDMDFVHIDDSYGVDMQQDVEFGDNSDFIVLDDADMFNDFDVDAYSSDINEIDVSIIV